MKKQDVEDKVRQAFTHATPDALDAVLAGCEGQSAEVTVLAEKRPMPKWARWAAGAAAALLLLAGGGVGPVSYTHLDVYKRQGRMSVWKTSPGSTPSAPSGSCMSRMGNSPSV